MKPTIVIFIAVAILAGCAVGPDYQQPKTGTPSQWTSSLNGGETNSPADLASWWQNFNDTTPGFTHAYCRPVQPHFEGCGSPCPRSPRPKRRRVRQPLAFLERGRLIYSQPLWRPCLSSAGRLRRHTLDYNLYNANFDAAWELDVFSLLRKTLDDDSREPRFIETVPTAGYRFIAQVEMPRAPTRRDPPRPLHPSRPPDPRRPRRRTPPADRSSPRPLLLLRLPRGSWSAASTLRPPSVRSPFSRSTISPATPPRSTSPTA